MTEPSEYLQPDFNPSSYKVAQLRNVLLQNDISYPSNAKKQDLIDLFNEHVKPTAPAKLLELTSVVANDAGIEVVQKKVSKTTVESNGELKVAKKRSAKKEDVDDSEVRKSPRKTSKSSKLKELEDDGLRSPTKKSSSEKPTANVLGKVPSLQVSPPRVRERSPRRSASKSSEVAKDDIKRERSPRRKAVNGKGKTVTKPEPVTNIDDDDDGEDNKVEIISKEEYESPFKVDKIESSFSNDNVFQSPGLSSPEYKPKKIIPRKRGTEDVSKSPRKTTKSIRKTAFSSSPEPARPTPRSPSKKALEISKFEDNSNSPPSNILQNELGRHDIFGTLEDDFNGGFVFNNVTELSPESQNPTPVKQLQPVVPTENFDTPNEGNASRFTDFSSAAATPSESNSTPRRLLSLIPDFSKFKVSTGFAQKLGIAQQDEPKKEAENNDPELLEDNSDDDEPESEHEDSTLTNLKKDVESANADLLKEAKEAVKQVNEIFEEDFEPLEEEKVKSAPRKPFNFGPFIAGLKQLAIFTFFVFIVLSGLWYREQRVLIGYCGSEIDLPTFGNTDNEYLRKANEFLQTVKPNCLPCPENAICLTNMKIKCKQDFIVYKPWYKFYDLLPLSDYCVQDKEKENIISEVVSKSLDLLRTRNANFKCGDGEDLEVGISDEELYQFFFNSKSDSISDEEFDELWSRVIEDLENEPEISLQFEGGDDTRSSSDDISTDETEEKTDIPQRKQKIIFRSHSSAKLSISCKFKKEIYERFQENKSYIIGSGIVSIIVLYAYFQILSYKERQSKIQEISDIIITKLQKQTKNSINDPTGLTNSYVSAIQLRDELLNDFKYFQNKNKLWDSILKQLSKNSSVRSSTKEIHGEIVKVLQWIGDVN